MELALREAAVGPAAVENSLVFELSQVDEEYFVARVTESSHSDSGSEDEYSGKEDNADSLSGHSAVQMEVRELDKEEVETVKGFSDKSCGCVKKHGLPCSTYFAEAGIGQMRMSMAKFECDQLDLVILAQIDAYHYSGNVVGHRTEAEKLQRSERTKDYTGKATISA